MEDKELAELASQAKQGNLQAFEELYASQARFILFHIKNYIYDKENYEDVAQEVALRLYEQIGKLNNPLAFRAWMHQIVRNVCVDHNRHYLRQKRRLGPADEGSFFELLPDDSKDIDPSAAWDAKLEGNAVHAALCKLSAKSREILFLRYYSELSYNEIAEALGLGLSNVKVRIHRATGEIRALMGEEDDRLRSDEFSDDDPKLKSAIAGVASILVSDETVAAHVEHINESFDVAESGQPFQESPKMNHAAVAAVSTLVVLGVFMGVAGYASTDSAEPNYPTEVAPIELLHEYEGTAEIIINDTKSIDSSEGTLEIMVVEDHAELRDTRYEVSDQNGTILFYGEEAVVSTAELDALPPGEYAVTFILTDNNGASASLVRTFQILANTN